MTDRNEASWALRHCAYLSPNDKLVFTTLLLSVDFKDCHLPERWTPTRPELVAWTGLSASSVKRSVNHLVSHGWLACETGRGNGRKSRYRLLPGAPDADCGCTKVSERTLSVVTKEVTENPYVEPKGVTQTPERVHSDPSKGSTGLGNPQVETGIPRKEGWEGKGEGVTARDTPRGTQIVSTSERTCDYHPAAPGIKDNRDGSYRCRRCGPHLWKEPAA